MPADVGTPINSEEVTLVLIVIGIFLICVLIPVLHMFGRPVYNDYLDSGKKAVPIRGGRHFVGDVLRWSLIAFFELRFGRLFMPGTQFTGADSDMWSASAGFIPDPGTTLAAYNPETSSVPIVELKDITGIDDNGRSV